MKWQWEKRKEGREGMNERKERTGGRNRGEEDPAGSWWLRGQLKGWRGLTGTNGFWCSANSISGWAVMRCKWKRPEQFWMWPLVRHRSPRRKIQPHLLRGLFWCIWNEEASGERQIAQIYFTSAFVASLCGKVDFLSRKPKAGNRKRPSLLFTFCFLCCSEKAKISDLSQQVFITH